MHAEKFDCRAGFPAPVAPRAARGRLRSLPLLLVGLFLSPWAMRAAPLDGLWASDGYRRVLEVEGNKVKAYELTAVSCLPAWEVEGTVEASGAIAFLQNGCERRLSLDADTGLARLAADCCSFDFMWERLKEKPKGWGESVANTPQANFAVWWRTFAENYAFFELRQVDWEQAGKTYGSQVTERTTPSELAAIFQKMTAPLRDAHVRLAAPELNLDAWGRRTANQLAPYGSLQWQRAMEIIATKHVPDLKHYGQNKIHFGTIDGTTGYLCINSFGGFAPGGVAREQNAALDAALDEIFRDAAQWRGLVIDLRVNSGGFGRMDLALASRLTAQRYLAYTTVARTNLAGPLQFTPPQEVWVEPSPRPGYRGPVTVLTSRDTVSCAENFVLATIGRKPAVKRIGENTQGVFSEVLARKLPNGWTFGLSNQMRRTADGKSFEGAGIPPDIAVPVFTTAELKGGKDSGLEKALEVLKN